MGEKKQKKFLTVAPFECAWRKELRFKEAGRGCVAFEASAHNDVTVVFREQVGSQHYHYKMDNSPNYTVVLGSHRNRRLKIEVNGKTVVDAAGVGLCCSSEFQSYWISIYDGLICIGTGRYPFQNPVFEWLDSKPNRNVQYVGLSSWDKHVGYRNVNVLPLTPHHNCLWKHFDHIEYEGVEEDWEDVNGGCEVSGLGNFLESWDLSDMFFLVGVEEKTVPAHMVILGTAGNFHFSPSGENVIRLPLVTYPVLHAFLQYIYTGQTQIVESQLGSLRDLSLQFQVLPLVRQCEEIIDRFKTNKKLFDSGKKVELAYSTSRAHRCTVFPCELPIDVQKLKQLLLTGKHSDVNIYIDGHGLVARAHKLILSLWSSPFMKMFTNGMSESKSSEVYLRDVSVDAFSAMLQFMYNGELEMKDRDDMGDLLLQLLLLADQFGVTYLQQECCNSLLECLSENPLVPIEKNGKWFASLLQFGDANYKQPSNFNKRGFSCCPKILFVLAGISQLFNLDTFTSLTAHLGDDEKHYDIQNYMDSICPVLQIVSSIPSCKVLAEMCERNFSRHFNYCTTASTDFMLLDEATFMNILQHPDLTVTSEERVLDAILLWCMQACEILGWEAVEKLLKSSTPELLFGERLGLMETLLPFVRFPLMLSASLKKLEKSSFCSQIPLFQQLVTEAIKYSESEMTRPVDNQNVRFQHRQSSFKELQYICDGDNNGVIYFAGTSYGEHQWVNPVLAKKITVTASSPASRYTDPKALVSRTYQATSFAGPRIENGRNCAWWMVDIGQDHQGSLNGENWVNLRVHDNDQTICKPGQFASWPIHGPTTLLPFRFFRVILTGPTTSDSNPWNLCICFLELYGYFH